MAETMGTHATQGSNTPRITRYEVFMLLHRSPHWSQALTAIALASASLFSQASTSGVVISQVYGGGGNSGATLTHDFIELYNAGSSTVSLNAWSVQYASATGSTWQVTPLTNVSLQPGQYYLVQQAKGTGGTTALPTPDAIGTIAMSATGGKVALVSNATALTGAAPTGAQLVDLVGFGSANAYEGTGAAPAPSNTVAVVRALSGCTDSDQNNTDFSTAAPTPRNTALISSTCAGAGPTAAPATIPQIQGDAAQSPYLGQRVRTSGVVTKLTNNGFFLQDPLGDANPATSDGVLVYTGSTPTVAVGQRIQLDATVAEFNTGAASNAFTAARPVTELISPAGITLLSSGHTIPATLVALPLSEQEWEQVEGMLVTITNALTVSQNYFQGRYGQVTLSAGGRLEKPTNTHRPGSPEALSLAEANTRHQILLDDGSSQQNPSPTPYIGADNTLRAGDTTSHITGVIDFGLMTASNTGLAGFKIHPTQAVVFQRDNPRTSAPTAVGGNVRIASANVLNYFTTFVDGKTASGLSGQGCAPSGTTSDCRGANSAAEFARQRSKTLTMLQGLNADVVGLMELQNNSEAIADLVAGLNAQMGAGTYAFIQDPASGVGTDAIKLGLIYKPGALTPVGASVSSTDPSHKRPPLAQTFAGQNGERFTVVVNHFKSKGCSGATGLDADQGDGQGCFNASRIEEAQALNAFVNDLKVTGGTPRVLVLGDLNAYGKEDPVVSLTDAGLVDLAKRFNRFDYSYVFDGEAGSLDHALATPELNSIVTGTTVWHINADEPSVIDYNLEFKQPACATCGPDYYSATPYRSSDHDPLVMGLNLTKSISGGTGRDTIVGTAGDDIITGGEQSDTLTGGLGRDVFVYRSIRDGLDTITDFVPGTDRIDLSELLSSLGITPTAAIANNHIRLVNTSAGTQIQVDVDGSSGSALPRALTLLKGISPAQLLIARDLGL